jgi:23S rRNA (adenine2503-C2)-methyltransferase
VEQQRSFFDLTPDAVRERIVALGVPAYRADQVLRWAYQRFVAAYAEMTELPAGLRERLTRELPLFAPPVLVERRSADGSTLKALLQLDPATEVESVLMSYDPTGYSRGRETVCVSTQAGCAMGCTFCATGQQGFLRNLSPGEITAQVLHFARELAPAERRITNVVFMGMGEPLANYENTLSAIRTLSDPRAFAMSARRITVSTVGLTPMIRRLAGEGLPVGLAVSLHSPDDELRRRLVPTARQTVLEIVAAADAFTAATGRRYTIEYALLDHVNDGLDLANRLATLLRGRPCHVNLIPVNPTANSSTRRPSRDRVLAFERVLALAEINVTVRAEKGIDIAAGCGQLRGEQQGMRPAARPLSIG